MARRPVRPRHVAPPNDASCEGPRKQSPCCFLMFGGRAFLAQKSPPPITHFHLSTITRKLVEVCEKSSRYVTPPGGWGGGARESKRELRSRQLPYRYHPFCCGVLGFYIRTRQAEKLFWCVLGLLSIRRQVRGGASTISPCMLGTHHTCLVLHHASTISWVAQQ